MRHEHLLIIRFSALGDVAMMVPVVYSLAKQYPHLRITVLSRDYARAFFDDLAPNVNFMAADVKHEYRGLRGLNSLYRRLAAKQFTAVADFHNVLRSDFLRMRFTLGHYRVAHIDKHRKGRRQLISQEHRRLLQQPTSFEKYADVLARLGYPVDIQFTSIFPPEGGNQNLLPAAIGPKNTGDLWVGVAPFAAHDGKIYPPRLMLQVLQLVRQRHENVRFFFFGRGENEELVFEQWNTLLPRSVSVSRQMDSMYQELILMSHLNVMISMDSANMHLASLTATPVVSVWGATHPYAGFMGWNQSADNAVQLDLDCRPCSIYGHKPCLRGDYACLRNIPPEAIADKVEHIVNPKQSL